MANFDYTYGWPDIFSVENNQDVIQAYVDAEKSDAKLCANMLTAWGFCHASLGPLPDNFGMVMALVSRRLGIIGTPESFMMWSDKFLEAKARETANSLLTPETSSMN